MSSDLHVGCIDWASKIHQRRVIASLVQGSYNRENERREKNKNGMEKAETIAERLGFEISEDLVDTDDGSYFATIFKYKYAHPNSDPKITPPKYVISFRGTCKKWDVILDIDFIIHKLHESIRIGCALEAVERIISLAGGPENVWLAGHSLGSAIALMVGQNMVVEKYFYLKTYLFNPPFVAYSNIKLFRHIYWYGRSILTAALEKAIHHSEKREETNELFQKLIQWKPYMFVNNRDYISNGYICYFKQRKKMNRLGGGRIENIATQHSVVSLFGETVGINFEPIHLIPSANLTSTEGSIRHPTKAHGIKQWWQNDYHLSIKEESYSFSYMS